MPKQPHWSDEYFEMIRDCEARESRLNPWEAGFIESIGDYITTHQSISQGQIETLEKIWEKATERG